MTPRGTPDQVEVRAERLYQAGRYAQARFLFKHVLRSRPDAHWVLTTVGGTYYEQRQYARALAWNDKAIEVMPRCPLVLWDRAGALAALGRHEEAERIWRSLLNGGLERLAANPCYEGVRWSRGLLSDCRYRLADSLLSRGRVRQAREVLRGAPAPAAAGIWKKPNFQKLKARITAAETRLARAR